MRWKLSPRCPLLKLIRVAEFAIMENRRVSIPNKVKHSSGVMHHQGPIKPSEFAMVPVSRLNTDPLEAFLRESVIVAKNRSDYLQLNKSKPIHITKAAGTQMRPSARDEVEKPRRSPTKDEARACDHRLSFPNDEYVTIRQPRMRVEPRKVREKDLFECASSDEEGLDDFEERPCANHEVRKHYASEDPLKSPIPKSPEGETFERKREIFECVAARAEPHKSGDRSKDRREQALRAKIYASRSAFKGEPPKSKLPEYREELRKSHGRADSKDKVAHAKMFDRLNSKGETFKTRERTEVAKAGARHAPKDEGYHAHERVGLRLGTGKSHERRHKDSKSFEEPTHD